MRTMTLLTVERPNEHDGVGRSDENPEAFCSCYAIIISRHHSVREHRSNSCTWDGPCGSCWHCLDRQFVHANPDAAVRDRMLAEALTTADQFCVNRGHPVTVLDPESSQWFCTTCQRYGLL